MDKLNIFLKLIAFIIFIPVITLFNSTNVLADQFNSNLIMDDSTFNQYSSMSAQNIDDWLNNNFGNLSCISTAHGFSAPDPIGYNPTQGYIFGGLVSAGQIIYDASQAYQINPKVLIATLQKEQGLVYTANQNCSVNSYSAATGYGCPDIGLVYSYTGVNLYAINGIMQTSVSGTCVNSISKVGFSQQLIHTAWLLKFGEQRSEGKISSAIINGSWNNSDDLNSCYSGPMIAGNYQVCPNGPYISFDGTYIIDSTTINILSGATAALYYYTPHFSGNMDFFNIFNNWFGSTQIPMVFKSINSSAVYIQSQGYKFLIPNIAILQDYGFDPNNINILSDSVIQSIPSPDSASGYSSSIGDIAQVPGDSAIYGISIGKRYAFNSMQQYNSFGLDFTNVSQLPSSLVYSLNYGGSMNNYISLPSSNVFFVNSGMKHLILQYQKFINLDPSGITTPVSSYFASVITSGNLIDTGPLIIGDTKGTLYLYASNNLYVIPSMNVLNCLGLVDYLHYPVYLLSDDSYFNFDSTNNNLSCIVNINNINYFTLGNSRINIPNSFNIPLQNNDNIIGTILNNLPTENIGLYNFIKGTSSTIYYINSGNKKIIPSMKDFLNINTNESGISVLPDGDLDSITNGGYYLSPGSLVRNENSYTVYLIDKMGYSEAIPSINMFNSYKFSSNSIEVLNDPFLNNYPVGNSIMNGIVFNNNNFYITTKSSCYLINSNNLLNYSVNTQNSNIYINASILNFNSSQCLLATNFIKFNSSSTIYLLNNGVLYPFSSWSSYLNYNNGKASQITQLDDNESMIFNGFGNNI